jgi:hypothetical protein
MQACKDIIMQYLQAGKRIILQKMLATEFSLNG